MASGCSMGDLGGILEKFLHGKGFQALLNRLFREAVESPSLEVFRRRVDV